MFCANLFPTRMSCADTYPAHGYAFVPFWAGPSPRSPRTKVDDKFSTAAADRIVCLRPLGAVASPGHLPLPRFALRRHGLRSPGR
jgi:hypothetical protein